MPRSGSGLAGGHVGFGVGHPSLTRDVAMRPNCVGSHRNYRYERSDITCSAQRECPSSDSAGESGSVVAYSGGRATEAVEQSSALARSRPASDTAHVNSSRSSRPARPACRRDDDGKARHPRSAADLVEAGHQVGVVPADETRLSTSMDATSARPSRRARRLST